MNSICKKFAAENGDPGISFLDEELRKKKKFTEKFKYIGYEWVDGWERMKSCGGWRDCGKQLFQLSFVLLILR